MKRSIVNAARDRACGRSLKGIASLPPPCNVCCKSTRIKPRDKRGPKSHPLTSTKQSAGSHRSGRVKRYTFNYTLGSHSTCLNLKDRSVTFRWSLSRIIDSDLGKPLVLCDQRRDNDARSLGSRKAGRAAHAGSLAVGPDAADGSYQDHNVVGDMDDCCQQGEPNERRPRYTCSPRCHA